MNPLTIKARHNVKHQAREDLLISIACGTILAALTVSFFI